MNKNILKVFASAAVILAAAFQPGVTQVVDRVVAKINNEVILLSDFNKRAEPVINEFNRLYEDEDKEGQLKELKNELLNQMIDEKLLMQKAKEENIEAAAAEVDQGVGEIRNRFESETAFQNEITGQGYTREEFRKSIEDQIKVIKLINEFVRDKISPPSEEEAREYYEENKEEMVTPERVSARHILIRITDEVSQADAREKIDEIYSMVKNEPDLFSRYAEEHSECPSAASGGDLGYFARGEMVGEFDEVAFNLNVGDISEPFITRFGYHIVKVTGKQGSENKTYAEVKDRLKNMLYQVKMEEAYEKFLNELRNEANITRSL